MQKTDGQAFHAMLAQRGRNHREPGFVQRDQRAAVRRHPLADREAKLTRYERRRLDEIEIRRIEAALITALEHIAKTVSREKRRASAAPLQDRVGGEGGAGHAPYDRDHDEPAQMKGL